jgi:hypothetical protein
MLQLLIVICLPHHLLFILLLAGALHFYMFFMPYFIMFKRQFVQVASLALFLTGPFLASYLTSSVNEQPAIWCLGSVFQAVLFGFAVRYMGLHSLPVLDIIHHPGGYGEIPLAYKLMAHSETVEKQLLLGVDTKLI